MFVNGLCQFLPIELSGIRDQIPTIFYQIVGQRRWHDDCCASPRHQSNILPAGDLSFDHVCQSFYIPLDCELENLLVSLHVAQNNKALDKHTLLHMDLLCKQPHQLG